MNTLITGISYYLVSLFHGLSSMYLYIYIIPVVVFIELPLYIVIIAALLRKISDDAFMVTGTPPENYRPKVTCIVTCYNEGKSVIGTIQTLTEQIYDGVIEILIIIDDAVSNDKTLKYAKSTLKNRHLNKRRILKIIPKATRGGLVSSRNIGLKLATGDIVIAIDGDCSCDNDMIYNISRNFYNNNVVAVSGGLRIRNFTQNLLTRLQGIEYILGIQIGRLGLARINIINNVSGAFGAFRKETLKRIGGWRNGTAEDLDLTLRIKALCKRYPKIKIDFNEKAIIHTDAPDTFKSFIKQRIRWEGDMLFIYFIRYWKIIRPKFLGWKIFLGLIWYNILFCVIAPPATILYVIYLAFFFPCEYVIAMLIFLYIYYFCLNFLMFSVYIILISERKKQDIKSLWLLLIIPVYHFCMKILTTAAFIIELTIKSHRDSSMAPWWVLKKTENTK